MADQHKPRGDKPRGQQRPARRPATGEQRRGQERRAERGGQRPAPRPRSAEQARYDGPPLDESIKGSDLSREVRQQLRGLPEKLAARVARHLVAAAQLIDEDPRTAYEHTLAARGRAARIAVVREACGEAAYAAGAPTLAAGKPIRIAAAPPVD